MSSSSCSPVYRTLSKHPTAAALQPAASVHRHVSIQLSAVLVMHPSVQAGGPSAGMPTFIDSLLNALSSIFGGFGVLSGT